MRRLLDPCGTLGRRLPAAMTVAVLLGTVLGFSAYDAPHTAGGGVMLPIALSIFWRSMLLSPSHLNVKGQPITIYSVGLISLAVADYIVAFTARDPRPFVVPVTLLLPILFFGMTARQISRELGAAT